MCQREDGLPRASVVVEAGLAAGVAAGGVRELGDHLAVAVAELVLGGETLVAVVAVGSPVRAVGVLAAVLGALDLGLAAEHVGLGERANVDQDAVVEVGCPADGLLVGGLPADEEVVGRLALEDLCEAALEVAGGGEPEIRAGDALLGVGGLGSDPVAEVAVGELLQRGPVERVVEDKGAVLPAVPDVPDEGAIVEPLEVLGEEPVAEPLLGGGFAADSDEGDDPVIVGVGVEGVRDRAGVVVGLGGPAVADEAGDGRLERVG